MTEKWHIEGKYFESCTCDIACPCIFLKPPTKGTCKAMIAWQIAAGYMEDTDLAGLNVGLYLQAPGNMVEGGWKIALYLDSRANDAQTDALTRIYGGQVGGHPAVLASLVGEVMSVQPARIDINYGDSEKTMDIEGVGSVKTKRLKGADGNEVTVVNPPLAVAPGYPLVVHETESLSYSGKDEHSHSGTVGFASPFSYQP